VAIPGAIMSTKYTLLFFRMLYLLTLGLCVTAEAQNLTVLKAFSQAEGTSPYGTPVLSGNVLYGTTLTGGPADSGTIYKINTDGSAYTLLKSFDSTGPKTPMARLLLSGNILYGCTVNDYNGTTSYGAIFKINTDGTGYTVLKHFDSTSGSGPHGGLVLSGSTLYGTTYYGGTWDLGTVFKINIDGTGFKMLREFTPYDGANPAGDLTISGNMLYGTTYSSGGTNGLGGIVFKIKTDGSGFGVLKSFGYADGNHPYAGLVLSSNTLYGAAYSSGIYSSGTLFKLNTNGTGFTVVHAFDMTNGANPYATLTLSGSTLYGTAYSGGSSYIYGAVFQINTDGSGYTVLKHMLGTDAAGSHPYAGVAVSGSTLYGANCNGGAKYSGTIYSLSPGPAAPVITSQPQSRTNIAGTTATFQVTATPTNGLACQWRRNNTNLVNGSFISGATSNVLSLANVQSSDAGNYTVVLSNSSGSVTSSVATLTIKRAPIAGADFLEVPLGLSLPIPVGTLLANDSDPDGTAFNISAVQSPSASGANLTVANGVITYWGAFSGTADHFTYTLTNAAGLAASGSVNITLTGSLPGTNFLTMQAISGGDLRLIFLGRLTFRYALDRTHDLNPPQTWEPLETNWAGARGYVFFTNTPSPGSNNFYRARHVTTFP
jgi:uncharacterized repeat protein (TIGR03803 family)